MLTRDQAMTIFNAVMDRGWAVSIKHRQVTKTGKLIRVPEFSIEIPTELLGDPAYKQDDAIIHAFQGLPVKIEKTKVGTIRIT